MQPAYLNPAFKTKTALTQILNVNTNGTYQ